MACVVCQHCQSVVPNKEPFTVREGYSYHKKCLKCYVCSETDLHNAEVFKGVIFCYSCSQRIFQGCSTAKKFKNGHRVTAKTRTRRRDKTPHQEKSRRYRPMNDVLELTRLAASTESENSIKENNSKTLSTLYVPKPTAKSHQDLKTAEEDIYKKRSFNLKKDSAEVGMTTEVTERLLRQLRCPVVNKCLYEPKPRSPVKSPQRRKGDNRYNKKICSDLRIAELGASTEIAHMALRKKSEQPVIVGKSVIDSTRESQSTTSSDINRESDASRYEKEESQEKKYALIPSFKTRPLRRTIYSLSKIPYKLFKKNILNRSSLVSIIVNSTNNKRLAITDKLKTMFHEEIPEHQDRGIRRLYSTINRRRTPYKLGWLNLMAKVSATLRPEIIMEKQSEEPKRCKHFERSHSYRCMRAQAMKLAGPTKSELACYRKKIKRMLSPPPLFKFIMGRNKILMSQACGNDAPVLATQDHRKNKIQK